MQWPLCCHKCVWSHYNIICFLIHCLVSIFSVLLASFVYTSPLKLSWNAEKLIISSCSTFRTQSKFNAIFTVEPQKNFLGSLHLPATLKCPHGHAVIVNKHFYSWPQELFLVLRGTTCIHTDINHLSISFFKCARSHAIFTVRHYAIIPWVVPSIVLL